MLRWRPCCGAPAASSRRTRRSTIGPANRAGILLAFWRALFAGLLVLPAVRRPRWNVRLAPMVIAFAAMNVLYLTAMTRTTGANAIWLQSTAPWWVFVFNCVILRHPVDRRDLLTLAFGVAGITLILYFESQGKSQVGIACGLGSAVAYAGVVLSLRSLRHENAIWLVALNHLFTAAVIAPFVIYADVWPTSRQLPMLAAFGFFQMALPYALFARGLKTLGSQEATGLGLLEPVLLPIWVLLAWGEVPAHWTLWGAGMILTGLLLRYTLAERRPTIAAEISRCKTDTE